MLLSLGVRRWKSSGVNFYLLIYIPVKFKTVSLIVLANGTAKILAAIKINLIFITLLSLDTGANNLKVHKLTC